MALVLNLDILKKANQNLDASNQPANNDVDEESTNRRDEIVSTIVHEVRAAIQTAGRVPLSVTPNTVPPGAKRHVLNMAAWQIVNSTPNLNMAILTEKGISTPFAKFYEEAVKYIDSLTKGNSVPAPTDPCGQDYETAVSDTNPAISSVNWGDVTADDTDYERGYYLTSGGSQVNLPVDNMNTL